MIRRLIGLWRKAPRGVRWGALALVVVTLAAGLRVGVLVLRSNAPYAAEIAADVAAWEAGRAERARLREEAKAALGELPAVFALRNFSEFAGAVARNENRNDTVEKMKAFYESLPAEMRRPSENEVVPGLLSAEDPLAYLFDALLAETAWIADGERLGQVVMLLEYEGGWWAAPPPPLAWCIGIAAAHAQRGDAALALEAALGGMEALASVPGPFAAEAIPLRHRHMGTLAIVALTAAGRTPVSEAQWLRFDAGLDAVSDPAAVDEALRISAACQLTPSAAPYAYSDSPFWFFGLYEYARNYRAIESGAAPAPYDLHGFAEGQQMIQSYAAEVDRMAGWVESVRIVSGVIRGVRRFEAERGRLPATANELMGLFDPSRIEGVDAEVDPTGALVISMPSFLWRVATIIRVTPLGGS